MGDRVNKQTSVFWKVAPGQDAKILTLFKDIYIMHNIYNKIVIYQIKTSLRALDPRLYDTSSSSVPRHIVLIFDYLFWFVISEMFIIPAFLKKKNNWLYKFAFKCGSKFKNPAKKRISYWVLYTFFSLKIKFKMMNFLNLSFILRNVFVLLLG